MTSSDLRAEHLVQKLRRILPLAAHRRPPFAAALRRRLACPDVIPRVMVTDIFYAGEEKGLMCRVDVQGLADDAIVLVAPVTQLAFNRRHPIARDIAAYRKRRVETAAVNCLGDR